MQPKAPKPIMQRPEQINQENSPDIWSILLMPYNLWVINQNENTIHILECTVFPNASNVFR